MATLKSELELFLLALGYLTRLPVPASLAFDDARLARAARYFPLVGLVVGAVTAAAFWLSFQLFADKWLALLLSMALGVLLTGGFHEDGFADCCDGFGGGWQPDQVLAIMKDSRLGSYGALGLGLMLATKLAALAALPLALVPAALLLAHVASRLLAVSLMSLPYVREGGKAAPVAQALNAGALALATLPLLPALWLFDWQVLLAAAAALLVLRWRYAAYLRRRLGGYTGDCLGAAQQLGEVLVYLAVLAALRLLG